MTSAAVAFSIRWQSGSLRWYLAGSLVFAVGLSGLTHLAGGDLAPPGAHQPAGDDLVRPHPVRDAGLHGDPGGPVEHAPGAAIALTSNGFLTALLFVVYRSPDILLTQILIETVSRIFLLLILYYMPVFRAERAAAHAHGS